MGKSLNAILLLIGFIFLQGLLFCENCMNIGKSNAELILAQTTQKTLFIINIKEYYKEEFEKDSKPEDYKTKVSISKIENRIIKDLKKIGIKEEDIVVVQEVVVDKESVEEQKIKEIKERKIKITIHDLKVISKIMNIENKKGIMFMHMSKADQEE